LGSLAVWKIIVGPTGSGISPQMIMRNKYQADKERIDIITERLVHRQDIWQDRYIYYIAVAIGHILEYITRETHE
jgi:hypothetical protein